MEVVNNQTREEYVKIQIDASKKKFCYCKVSTYCAKRFREIISRSSGGKIKGPVLCLGTRNGREVDIFRIYFFGNPWLRFLVRLFEIRRYGFSCRIPFIERWCRGSLEKIDENSVLGVEINPDSKRKDILISSFDELPLEWESKFGIVYSNALDHAYDPYKAAQEWYRILKKSGYMIISYPDEVRGSSLIDHVGRITFEDIRDLFPGEIIYFNKFGTIFRDIIIRKK